MPNEALLSGCNLPVSITLLYKNDLILIAIHGTDQRISEERDRKNLHKTQS